MRSTRTVLSLAVACLVALAVVIGFMIWSFSGPVRETAESARDADPRILTPAELAEVNAILEQVSSELSAANYSLAQRELEDAIEQYGRYRPLYEFLFQAHLGQGRFEEAYSAVQEAINIGPATASMHDAAAMAAAQSGFVREAVQHYALAMSLDPSNPKYPLYRAQLHIKLHEYDQARRFLLQTINIDDQQEYAWGTLAQLALQDNSPDLALQYLESARAINPQQIIWLIEESKARRRKNEPERAALLLSGLSDDQLDQAGVLEELSTCYAMLGQREEAANAWQARSERQPRDWYAAWQAAQWFEVTGQSLEALRYAEIALVLAPEEERARMLWEKLSVAAAASGE